MINSIVTVLTPATIRNLTNLDRVKMDLSITDSVNDDLIETLISEATAKCETYCNRTFATETVKEVFRMEIPATPYALYNGPPLQHLVLSRFPLQSLTSLVADGTTLGPTDFEVDTNTGFIYRLNTNDDRVPWRFKKVTATYVTGYKLPDQPGRNLPADLESACLMLVKHRWFGRRRDPLVKSQIIPQVIETEYWVGAPTGQDGDISPEVAGLLEPYRTHGYLGV